MTSATAEQAYDTGAGSRDTVIASDTSRTEATDARTNNGVAPGTA
jgi:hypothetical protein